MAGWFFCGNGIGEGGGAAGEIGKGIWGRGMDFFGGKLVERRLPARCINTPCWKPEIRSAS